jgi:SAM-dependent methyltransferase
VSEHLDLLALVYSGLHTGIYPLLDESLEPRSPDLLFDMAGEHLAPDSRLLDVGCRDAAHLVRLVETHDLVGVGIDPLSRHVGLAAEAIELAGLRHRVVIARASMERLPVATHSIDFVWCRDVVEHVDDLAAGLAEVARVLVPAGHSLLYTDFATERLEPQEAAQSFEPRGIVAHNMDEHLVEADFARAGLVIRRKEVVGTEWREHAEERTQPVSRDLLRLARLRRRRAEVVERFGQDVYDRAEGGLQWAAYQLMGKLQPTVYLLAAS